MKMELICSVVLFLFAFRNLSEVEGADDTECSPILDKFIRRGKCRYCQACDEGRGRNFTLTFEQIKKLDNTKCLPCEKCPDGSFNDKQDFKNTCRPCTYDKCYKLNREIQRRCKSTSDQICGSCIHGYNDDFHRDHKQPCYKNPTRSSTVPTTTQVWNTVSPLPLKTTRQDNIGNMKDQKGQKRFDPKDVTIAIVFALISVVLVCLLVFIRCIWWKRRRGKCFESENNACDAGCSITTLDSSATECSSLIKGQSPQTDGLIEGESEQEEIQPDTKPDEVRGELHSHNVPTQNDQRVENDEPVGKCGCRVGQCSQACEISSTDDHIVNKEHGLLNLIASKICHAPDKFFDALEIDYSEIYHLDDNRSRAPEKFSQKEFIRSVLNRWVEIKGQNATCGRIRKALCAGGFHRINTIYSQDNDFGMVD